MVDVGMREDERVERADVERELAVADLTEISRPLEQPAVEQDVPTANFNEMS
jgi:hypothetical protein